MSARVRAALLLLLLAALVACAEWPLWTLLVALLLAVQAMRMAWVDLVEHGVRGGGSR